MHRSHWIVSCLLAVVLVGCGSQSASGPSSTPTSTAVSGLRGYSVASLACPAVTAAPASETIAPVPGVVAVFVVCPNAVLVGGPPRTPRTVTRSDGVVFTDLLAALSLPDIIDPSVSVCPAMAMVPRVILIRTGAGTYSAHLPTGTCHFYLPEVSSAIQAAEK